MYRSLIQLRAFLTPAETSDMMQSLVNDALQGGGAMPRWEQVSYNSAGMVGDSPAITVANAFAFGATNFDARAALTAADFAASTVGATSGGHTVREGLSDYLAKGYVSTAQSIFGATNSTPAVTLEYSSDDFALAQFALALGDTNKYQTYQTRSGNWRNVYNTASNYIQPRNPDGTWAANFSPTTSMVEGDSAQYAWMVPMIGKVQAASGSLSYISAGNNGGGSANPNRSYLIGAQLSGSGTLAMILFSTNKIMQVTNSQNSFSGNWIVQSGWLQGTAAQALGSGDITVNPLAGFPGLDPSVPLYGGQPAVLELAYPAVSPGTLTLANGGLMFLHSVVLSAA